MENKNGWVKVITAILTVVAIGAAALLIYRKWAEKRALASASEEEPEDDLLEGMTEEDLAL